VVVKEPQSSLNSLTGNNSRNVGHRVLPERLPHQPRCCTSFSAAYYRSVGCPVRRGCAILHRSQTEL